MTVARTTTQRGILLLIAATAVFTVMDVLSKQLIRAGMPVVEIAWARCACQLAAILAILGPRGTLAAAASAKPVSQIARGAMILGSSIFFVLGLDALPIATATATGFVSPLFVTALSIPLLGEKVGWRRWSAVFVGFAGVLVIVRPGGDGFNPAAVWPIISALSWAGALILTRRMSGERTETIYLWSALVGLIATGLALPALWVTPSADAWFWLLAMGAASAVGHLLLIRAFRAAEAALLAPFQYVQLVWATALGAIVWNELPDATTYAGAAIIVASGLYIWARERRLARALAPR
jgi:drug/metabolite transporter (DMT)-like permease